MASSFEKAFTQAYQADVARRRDEEAQIAREIRDTKRRALEGVVDEARKKAALVEQRAYLEKSAVAADARRTASDIAQEKRAKIASDLAKEETLAEYKYGQAEVLDYRQPFDLRESKASIEAQKGFAEAEDKLRKEEISLGIKTQPRPNIFRMEEGQPETQSPPDLAAPTPERFAAVEAAGKERASKEAITQAGAMESVRQMAAEKARLAAAASPEGLAAKQAAEESRRRDVMLTHSANEVAEISSIFQSKMGHSMAGEFATPYEIAAFKERFEKARVPLGIDGGFVDRWIDKGADKKSPDLASPQRGEKLDIRNLPPGVNIFKTLAPGSGR